MQELDDLLLHYGVKGMKWGVRRDKDRINSKDRTIKKGTTVQNITRGEYKDKDKHLYTSYTKADNAHYTDHMANFMYNGRGYRNEFKVKNDIKIPSDKKLTETFVKIAKDNPDRVARDMAAYNVNHIFSTRTAKHFEKKIKNIDKNPDKLTKQYISDLVSDKTKVSRGMFFSSLMRQGYNAMSDVNDRDQAFGTQDPLIIFNPGKDLSKPKSLKLTKDTLDKYYKYTMSADYKQSKKDLSGIQK